MLHLTNAICPHAALASPRPQVPDVESPSDTKLQDQAPPGYPSTSAPQQYPYPGYPNMPPPGVGLEAQQHLYPAGPGALPPAGTYPPYQGGPGGPPPPGAPGAPPPGEPAIGIPVLGDRVSYITHHPMWGPNDNTRDSRFTCTAWLTFFLGGWVPERLASCPRAVACTPLHSGLHPFLARCMFRATADPSAACSRPCVHHEDAATRTSG